jgi:hypothetical protein
MGRRPLDIEKIALSLIMSYDQEVKKKLPRRYRTWLISKGFILPAYTSFT